MYTQLLWHLRKPRRFSTFLLGLSLATIIISGCGGGGAGAGTTFSGNTTVSVLISSTANDKLQTYSIEFVSLTLTDTSGNTVNLISSPLFDDFLQANGKQEPLLTTSIPQGEYVSAAATVKRVGYDCVYLGSNGGLVSANFSNLIQRSSPAVTVTLPASIKVTGSSMALSLNLLASQSASWNPSGTDCAPLTGSGTESANPTFTLQAIGMSSSQPGNEDTMGLIGEVTATDASSGSFSVAAAGGEFNTLGSFDGPGPVWQVHAGSNTTYRGIASSSQLAVGQLVTLDASLQPDGSLAASRMEVVDPNTSNLDVYVGPIVYVSSAIPSISVNEQDGFGTLVAAGANSLSFSNSTLFQISSQFGNLQNLPFPATFTSANMVPGQELVVTSHATSIQPEPVYLAASSFTLIPQTIDGTVTAVSNDGGFTVYTVTLAPYDLFSLLAVQQGQNTLVTSPNTVYVYADSNVQMLNTSPVTAGGVFRFYGLVFNDNGTLRMDCAQINDGVPL